MFRKRDIELIILEVLDCQDNNDKESIKFLKETDEEFSWKELARFQNLAASLPTQMKSDVPSTYSKELFRRKLNRIIFGKEEDNHPEKFIHAKAEIKTEVFNKETDEHKIDWGSLSVPNRSSQKLTGFEEVKTKTSVIKNKSPQLNTILYTSDEIDHSDYNESLESKYSVVGKETSKLRKLVIVSVVLFIVIIAISSYMYFNNNSQVTEVIEQQQPVETLTAELDVPTTDSTNIIQPTVQATDVQKVETLNKPQNEKNVLPKAPPKLPEPIEAPLITANEVVNKEEANVEEEKSAPPPKEVVEENEEPTFFVAVEEMPQPIGGLQGIQRKIQYPEIAKRAGVEGKVFVRAFVDENGNVVNAEIVKGIGAGCDEAALDAVLKTKFTPGKQRGKPIKVQVTVPVLFRL